MVHISTIIIYLAQAMAPISSPTVDATIRLELQIRHHFEESDLQLDYDYATGNGGTVILTKFKYYLSHLELVTSNGSIWKAKEVYHLVDINDETASTYKIILDNIPSGVYEQLSFAIGVDSVANHSGDQAGVLDPDYGMFWMWETGYTFFKIEGFYKTKDKSSRALVCHVGRDDCLRRVRLAIPSEQTQKVNTTKSLTIDAEINKIFGGYTGAAINVLEGGHQSSISIMGGDKALKVADNFSRIFSIRE